MRILRSRGRHTSMRGLPNIQRTHQRRRLLRCLEPKVQLIATQACIVTLEYSFNPQTALNSPLRLRIPFSRHSPFSIVSGSHIDCQGVDLLPARTNHTNHHPGGKTGPDKLDRTRQVYKESTTVNRAHQCKYLLMLRSSATVTHGQLSVVL